MLLKYGGVLLKFLKVLFLVLIILLIVSCNNKTYDITYKDLEIINSN